MALSSRTLASNPRHLAVYNSLHMMLFPISIMTLFWKHNIGMSMTEILAVQGFFGLVMALFEFPSGYVADRMGYRRTLMAASSLAIVGWGVYSFADTIWWVIAAEAILGISVSLVSGCDTALLYESLLETKQDRQFTKWSGRVRFWGQAGEGSAALAAGLLYVFWPPLPFVVQGVMSLFNLGVASRLVEPARHPPPKGQHLKHIRSMIRYTFVENRDLTAVTTLTIVLGMSSFIPVWLVPLYATGAGVPDAWIGPIWAVANYSVALGSLFSNRIVGRFGLLPTIAACIVFIALGYGGLALTFGAFGFAWYFCLTTMRGVFGPAMLHRENELIPSSDRAGFMSLRSMVFRLAFLALAPAIGAAVDAQGQHPVLATLGIGLTTAAVAGWLWLAARDRLARRAARLA
jgi:MFS family permease